MQGVHPSPVKTGNWIVQKPGFPYSGKCQISDGTMFYVDWGEAAGGEEGEYTKLQSFPSQGLFHKTILLR